MKEIVYSCENGGDYTPERMFEEINIWFNKVKVYKSLDKIQQMKLKSIIYVSLINRLEWECPGTLLDQMNKEEIELYLEELKEVS